jgi:copper transport protein
VLRPRLLAAAAVVIVALVAPAAASAHAILVRASPAPGAELRRAPSAVSARFSEPLNRQLSNLTLTGPGGRIAGRLGGFGSVGLSFKPDEGLTRGVYEVRWHSVSADDGHALDGAYYFGLGATAPAGASSSQTDPLSGAGWLRVLLRAGFDAALLLFCAGVFCAALLSRGGEPAAWLLPEPPGGLTDATGILRADRLWRRTVWVGLVAVVAGIADVLVDAADAGQGLSSRALDSYLLSDLTGEARIALLAALALAVLVAARRSTAWGSLFAVLALAGLSVSGHANSANPRALAIAVDLAHLTAAAVWVGGIAQIVWAWLPRLSSLAEPGRRRLIEIVLPRFGRIALPAFAVVLVAGLANAVIQLGSIPALWNDSYGRVLIIKMALVGAIAVASYNHALRIRPRILRGSRQPDAALERRHWRLLRSEPLLGAGVVLAGALLIAYPPPSRIPAAQAAAGRPSAAPAVPGPADATLARGQLSVAEEAGPDIVAAWVSRIPGGLGVKIRTLNALEQPTAAPLQAAQTTLTGSCGLGCHTATIKGSPSLLTVAVSKHGHTYTARLPIRYQPASDQLAQRLLSRLEAAEAKLPAAVVHESLASGPGAANITTYELQAPDRFAYQLSRHGRPIAESIIVGAKQWNRSHAQRDWQVSAYGGGSQPFSAASYLTWWTDYATQPRLLNLYRSQSSQIASIATLSEIQGVGPVWLRLRLDLTHHQLVQLRMITAAHFMTQIWSAPTKPLRIHAPPPATVRTGP